METKSDESNSFPRSNASALHLSCQIQALYRATKDVLPPNASKDFTAAYKRYYMEQFHSAVKAMDDNETIATFTKFMQFVERLEP